MEEKNKTSVKYQSEYFIDDFSNLMDSLQEKIRIISEIEFTTKQKAQVVGLIMGVASSFCYLNDKLKEWGFLK